MIHFNISAQMLSLFCISVEFRIHLDFFSVFDLLDTSELHVRKSCGVSVLTGNRDVAVIET